MMKRVRFIGLIFLAVCTLQAQEKKDMVYLEHCETLSFDQQRIPDAQILKGDVRFRHDSALMFCDSAYFYDKANSLDAFGHVRMIQGDTLAGYADRMYYDGNTKIVRFREHVRMTHKEDELTTDSLNYDRQRSIAYYFTGGTLRDTLNTLTSVFGQYNTTTSQAQFRNTVELNNKQFVLTSDTLDYNTDTKIADIVGPTMIVYDSTTTIESTMGWYNTSTEQSMLLQRSSIIHSDGMFMTGDTIYYDKKIGFGQVLSRMEMRDSTNKMTLRGDYGQMYEEGHRGYATRNALMIDWADSANYAYIHADTLFTEMVGQEDDSSSYRRVRAFFGVRLYRNDVQAVCDSLVYTGNDSIISLYTEPRCWNEHNQLSADTIRIYIAAGTVDHIIGIGSALAVKQESNEIFDQMAGKEIYAYVVDGEMRQVDVSGNAETIFYPKEESSDSLAEPEYIGMNRTMSSYVKIFIAEQKINRVLFTTESTGILYPMDQIPKDESQLSGFFWAEQERPKYPLDVMNPTQRLARPSTAIKSAISNIEEDEATQAKRKSRSERAKNRNKL